MNQNHQSLNNIYLKAATLHLAAVFIALAQLGCMEVQDKEKEEQKLQISRVHRRIEWVALGSWNSYQLQLAIPEGATAIKKTVAINQKQKLDFVSGPKYLDSEIVGGESYDYEFGTLSSGEFHQIDKVSVTAPIDLKIESTLTIKSQAEADVISSARQLVFTKGAVLITNGYKLNWDLEHLVSEDGMIRTFPINQTAPVGSQGRNGGYISIKAKTAKGLLFVEMRGENGGLGKTGEFEPGQIPLGPAKGAKGFSGGNGGQSGFLSLQIQENQDFSLADTHIPGLGGKGGAGGPPAESICMIGSFCPPSGMPAGDPGPEGRNGVSGQTCYITANQTRNCKI